MRGDTSGSETPHSAHARRSEKSIGTVGSGGDPPLDSPITSTNTTPSARRNAVSSESASRAPRLSRTTRRRSEEHTSELQSRLHLVCRLLLEKKKKRTHEETSNADDRY